MSETVILGSFQIWRQNADEIQASTEDQAKAIIEEEARIFEGVDIETELATGTDEDRNEGEENEKDKDEGGRNRKKEQKDWKGNSE
jgi:hypothetical protein